MKVVRRLYFPWLRTGEWDLAGREILYPHHDRRSNQKTGYEQRMGTDTREQIIMYRDITQGWAES